MILDREQYIHSASELDCVLMPVEPTAWYGILSYGGRPMWLTWARGENIETLHEIVDDIKRTSPRLCALVWIQRLTDNEVRGLGFDIWH